MQLLDSLGTQQPIVPPAQVLESLADIANKVQIQPNFCISHPDYKPLELPDDVITRFHELPQALQDKYLSLRLRNFLYGIYYNASQRKSLAPESEATELESQQNLENNTFLGVDIKFYEQLHSSNCGEGNFAPGWKVVKQESDGTLAVIKDGLTLYIEREKHLLPEQQSAVVGDSVSIRLPRNRVQSGFYMAIGNAGPQGRDGEAEIVRIYFNLSPEGAIAVMGALTRQMNNTAIPFSFKALYNPSDYERYDSAVLYFNKPNYAAVQQVLQNIYLENRAHFQTEVPLFTKWLAPGLALAEEPDQKFATKESFGTHRCQIVANGLIEAWQTGDDSPESRMKAICHQFSLKGVKLERPYLNANSNDIYSPLQLCS